MNLIPYIHTRIADMYSRELVNALDDLIWQSLCDFLKGPFKIELLKGKLFAYMTKDVYVYKYLDTTLFTIYPLEITHTKGSLKIIRPYSKQLN